MLSRAYIIIASAAFAIAPCCASQPSIGDGSSKETAIPLKQRGVKAVEEEMQWMMKLYHYTPLMATRDAVADAVRQIKAEKKRLFRTYTLGSTVVSTIMESSLAIGRLRRRTATGRFTSTLARPSTFQEK
jgi:hypothetical protein